MPRQLSQGRRKAGDNASARTAADAALIGEHLRRLFADVEREPLPERFETLLAQLAAEEADARLASDEATE